MFYMKNLRTNEFWPDARNQKPKLEFPNLVLAENAAKELNSIVPLWSYYTNSTHEGLNDGANTLLKDYYVHRKDVWVVVSDELDENWKERETKRFELGTNIKVPWENDDDWKSLIKENEIEEHFIHVPLYDKKKIAYTANNKDGKIDKKVLTTPGRYFNKFFKKADPAIIEKWTNAWASFQYGSALKFATTRDEIRNVYENGPDSCMKGKPSRWFGNREGMPHPTEVYAAGDLAIAYVEKTEFGVTFISARCLCWPERKLYSRVYGSDSSLLQKMLNADGYKGVERLTGARLLTIPFDEKKDPDLYIMPYIDYHYVRFDDNDALVMDGWSRTGTPAETTRGTLRILRPFVSALSGKKYNPYESKRVKVFTSETEFEFWADCELGSLTFNSQISGNTYVKDKVKSVDYLSYDGSIKSCAEHESKDAFEICQYLGVPVLKSDYYDVIVGYTKDGKEIIEKWGSYALKNNAFSYNKNDYANWLGTKLLGVKLVPFVYEHLAAHMKAGNSKKYEKFDAYLFTDDVTRETANSLLRTTKIADGQILAVYPEEVQKKIDAGLGIAIVKPVEEKKTKKTKKPIKKKTVEELAEEAGTRITVRSIYGLNPGTWVAVEMPNTTEPVSQELAQEPQTNEYNQVTFSYDYLDEAESQTDSEF